MYYAKRRNLGEMGEMGFVFTPAVIAAMIGGGTTLVGSTASIGAKLWGQSALEETQKKELKAIKIKEKRAHDAAQRAAIRQAEVMAREESLDEQRALIAEASARRNQTTIALYAVGGAALVISAVFVFAAMKPKGAKK